LNVVAELVGPTEQPITRARSCPTRHRLPCYASPVVTRTHTVQHHHFHQCRVTPHAQPHKQSGSAQVIPHIYSAAALLQAVAIPSSSHTSSPSFLSYHKNQRVYLSFFPFPRRHVLAIARPRHLAVALVRTHGHASSLAQQKHGARRCHPPRSGRRCSSCSFQLLIQARGEQWPGSRCAVEQQPGVRLFLFSSRIS
jgi:hypothetical protein